MRIVCSSCLNRLTIVDFGHSSNSPTSQSRVLVTISPTIHRSLNQSSLASQTGVELRQGPANRVAFRLIDQPITPVLILAAAGSRINTIFRLEFWTQSLDIHRLDIAPNCVFHLNAVARVLECNPLNPIVILSHNKWCSRGNRAWRSIVTTGIRATWNIVLVHLRSTILWMGLLLLLRRS
jgi:hypothetical protein